LSGAEDVELRPALWDVVEFYLEIAKEKFAINTGPGLFVAAN
jgi:hypothetical protein